MITIHKSDDTNNGMLTRKNWDKLMKLGKELGLPEDEMLHAYKVSITNAQMSGESLDFDSIMGDVKSGLAFHLEIVNVANDISMEFDIDPKESYKMMLGSIMEGDVIMQLASVNELPTDASVAKTAGDIVRKWLKLKMQF